MAKKILVIWMILSTLVMTIGFVTGVSSHDREGTTTPGEDNQLFLPLILKNHPMLSIFGMDGKTKFDRIAETGTSWVRLNTALLWSEVQPEGPTSFNWDNTNVQRIEYEILEAKSKGLAVLLIVRSTPNWAMKYPQTGKKCGPIARVYFDEFASFMREVVVRYSQPPYEVMHYAIWNEPEINLADTQSDMPIGCWGDPDESYFGGVYYGELLKELYPIVKGVNQNVQIVTGSFLMYCDPRWSGTGACPPNTYTAWANFFEGVLIGSQGLFDVVGYNGHVSYVAGINPVWSERNNWRWSRAGGLVDGKVNYLQEKMSNRLGYQKPIMLTEGGLVDGSDGDPVFEEAKSDYLVYGYANTWAIGLKANFWYTFEGWKGSALISGNQARPAFYAMKTMTQILKDAKFINREVFTEYEKFIYHRGSQEIWLLIPTGEVAGTSYNVSKPDNFVKLVDIYGNEQPDPGSIISFSRPVYVFRTR